MERQLTYERTESPRLHHFGISALNRLADTFVRVITENVINMPADGVICQVHLLGQAYMCEQDDDICLLTELHPLYCLLHLAVNTVEQDAPAVARCLPEGYIGVVDADEADFYSIDLLDPVRREQVLPIRFVTHVLRDNCCVVPLHHLQHDLFAVDHLPVSRHQEVVVHLPDNIGKDFSFRSGCIATSLDQVTTIYYDRTSWIFGSLLLKNGLDDGESSPFFENDIALFHEKFLVLVQLPVDISCLKNGDGCFTGHIRSLFLNFCGFGCNSNQRRSKQ